MILLRQGTNRSVLIGPFSDSTDGDTIEDGLTVSQATLRMSKNGANIIPRDSAGDCVHDELGWYVCSLNTADTDTLGVLRLAVHISGALQVWHEYMVVTANFWDAMFSTDKLQTHVVEYTAGVIDDDVFAAGAITVSTYAAGAIDDTVFAASAITISAHSADGLGKAWDIVLTGGSHNLATSSGRRLRQIETIFVLAEGVAQGGTASTITLEAGENSLDSFYNHVMVTITAGTGIGQARAVNDYTGATLVADIVPDWTTIPNSASTYELLADTGKHVVEVEAGAVTDVSFGVSAFTISAFAAGSIDSDVLGVSLGDILADTNELQTDWADGGRLDLILDSVLADIEATVPQKNAEYLNIVIPMIDETDDVSPKSGLTVTVTVSKDGSSYGATTGSIAEIGTTGTYQFDADAADMNGDEVMFKFSASGANDTFRGFTTRP